MGETLQERKTEATNQALDYNSTLNINKTDLSCEVCLKIAQNRKRLQPYCN